MGSTSGSGSGTPTNQDDNDQPPLWRYVSKIEKMGEGGGNTKFQCNYCQNVCKGSYFQVKTHLLKISVHGIKVCPKVTPQHLVEMQKVVKKAENRVK